MTKGYNPPNKNILGLARSLRIGDGVYSAALFWSQDDSILYSTSCPRIRRRSYFGLRDCSALDLFPDELR
jgi:hypothetical protein